MDYATAGQVNLVIVGDPKVLTWVGDGGANYWDTTSFNWTNSPVSVTNFTQGDYVTFNDSGSAVPDILCHRARHPQQHDCQQHEPALRVHGQWFGITSSGVLTKAGTNDLVLNNDGNAFTGTVDIRSGVLSIGAAPPPARWATPDRSRTTASSG